MFLGRPWSIADGEDVFRLPNGPTLENSWIGLCSLHKLVISVHLKMTHKKTVFEFLFLH